jgi:hypothetical protein
MKLFRFSNITGSIHAVADWLGVRAVSFHWLVVGLLAGSAGAGHAQFYQPNYITNNAGFDSPFVQAGKSLNEGPGPKFVSGWTYTGDAGVARDSTNKTNPLMTDDLTGYGGGNYAYLRAPSQAPGALTRTVNLPLRGNYQLQFSSPGAYTNRHVVYTPSVTDRNGNVLATTNLYPTSGDQTNSLYFSVTNPGLCTLSFGNLVNFGSPSNVVLLDNISIVKTDFYTLANGEFEATPLSPGQFQYYAAQSQPLDSWAYAGNAGIATDSSNKVGFTTGYPGVYARTNYAFLQTGTGTPGSLEQSVVLPTVGQWVISFSFAGRREGPAFGGNASFRASVIGSNGFTLVSTELVTASGQLFTGQTLPFSGYQTGPFTLRFDNVQNTSGTDNTVFIDNVQLLAASQLSAAAPIITGEPASVTNIDGTSETLHGSAVLLSGGTPIYQWFEGNSQFSSNAVPVALMGATNADFTLPATTNGYTRSFFLRAYNGSGVYSDTLTATVRIILPPSITSQPADQVILPGQTATLSVGVSGTAPLTYQWYIGDTSRPFGTNSSSFTTPPLSHDVIVLVQARNDAGSNYTVTSTSARVHVATIVTQEPSGLTVCPGDPATFAVGFAAPTLVTTDIQWQRRVPGGSFTNIPGATATNYTTPPVSAADDGSFFRALVSNHGTNLVTAEAPLSVVTISAPTIVYDFSSGLPTSTSSTGTTTNGWLDLHDPGRGQFGSFLTADLAPGQAVRGFIAHFTARISPAPSAPMGDGFSFNWGPDLPSDNFLPAEQGAGSGLRVCFITYDDGSGTAPAIDVKWGDNLIGRFLTNNAFLSNQGTNADVMVRLNTDGTFDMTYRCVSIFSRLPIPGHQPQFNSRFGLGASAFNGQEGVWIRDVSLQLFVDPTYGLPAFTSMTPQGQSGLAINGAGAPNAQYPLFTSQDLVNWQFRTNVTLGSNGLFQFVEPDISSPDKQFYRLKAAPHLPLGLVSWWRGDGNYLDSIGGRNGSPSTNAPDFTAGIRTPAFNFRGTNALSINSASLPAPWTLCFWGKGQSGFNGIQTVFSDTNSSLCLDADGNGYPGLTLSDGTVWSDDYFQSRDRFVRTHYTFVSDSTSFWIYVNGKRHWNFNPTGNFTLPLSVMGAGSDGVSNGLNAVLDEVMVFDRVLTDAEVSQVINATRAP